MATMTSPLPAHPPTSTRDTATSVDDLWAWWRTLSEDQQDLLRITASAPPLTSYVVDFLAWSDCPLVPHVGLECGPATVTDPDRLVAFVAQA